MKKRSLEKFNNLVDALEQLPGVGKKSAQRFAYHLVLNDAFYALKLAHAIEDAVTHIKKCTICNGISEDEICEICMDEFRDRSKLCVVESAKDIMIIEEGAGFEGRYFVLEGLDEGELEKLRTLVQEGVEEVIFAFTPSLANDSVIMYVEEKLKGYGVRFSKIAQGVPTGVNFENIDMLSLSKALMQRVEV
jgi:recombination protein RecR